MLRLLEAGEGAVGHQVPSLLHLQICMLGKLLLHPNKCTDLWQDLVDLKPPLDPPGPLLP